MTLEGALWVLGGYVVGTFPSTYLVARIRRAAAVREAAHRRASEADAHILIEQHLGPGWATLAATADVLKGFLYPLAARRFGGLGPEWLAPVGVAVVVGHGWPPYARQMAGRGLSAASGVLLALLPLEMVVAGVVIVAGIAVRWSGVASTAALASVPAVAAVQGQPGAYVAMGVALLGVVALRRLEGVGEVIGRGVPAGRAVFYRIVHDTSGPPRARVLPPEAPSEGPSSDR